MGNRKTRRHLKRRARKTRRLRRQRGGAGPVSISAEEWVRNAHELFINKPDNQITNLGELKDEKLTLMAITPEENADKRKLTFLQNRADPEDIHDVALTVREKLREIISLQTNVPLESVTPSQFKEYLESFPKSLADDTIPDSLKYLLMCENAMRDIVRLDPLGPDESPITALSDEISTNLLFIWALAVNCTGDPQVPALFASEEIQKSLSSEQAQPAV